MLKKKTKKKVTGFDISAKRIDELLNGYDKTNEKQPKIKKLSINFNE